MPKKPEFIQISKHIAYLKMPTNSGIISVPGKDGNTEIYIIDTGNTDSAGELILNSVLENFPGCTVKAILNTHSHADHFGGNPFIKGRTGCEVWTSKGEATLMEYPWIETQLIWGGNPILEIRSEFLYGVPSKATHILEDKEVIDLGEVKIEVISLPGHYVDPLGFLVKDSDGKSVFFVGDALSGRNVIRSYWIQYLLDEGKSKEAIKKIEKIKADLYIPGHGLAVDEIEGLTELNLIAIMETENMILDELKTPKTMEELLCAIAERNDLKMQASQYCLIGSTVRSYISSLQEEGKVTVSIQDNKMLWAKTKK